MDKIEKLVKQLDDWRYSNKPVISKINEIIDVLNSWLFEPGILNYPLNQKQPKGVEMARQGDNQVVKEYLTTEKKEEWRMEIRKGEKHCEVEIGGVGTTGLWENLYKALPFIFEMLREIYEGDLDKYLDQLLSERTFTKEELERIKKLVGFMENDYPNNFEKPEDKTIKEKIFKLLNK